MRPLVKLLSKPNIDYVLLIDAIKQSTNIDLNALNINSLSDFEKYLAYLSVLYDESLDIKFIEKVCQNTNIQHHLHFSFLIACTRSTLIKSMERTQLCHTISEQLDETTIAVVSGSIFDLKTSIIECTNSEDFNLKLLYNKIFLILKSQGFRLIFLNTKTSQTSDKTFRIEHK